MAVDLHQHGIQVNAVAPGWVGHTAMVDDFSSRHDVGEPLKHLNPVQRVGQPDELANVIEYLGFDAPAYLTGATISSTAAQPRWHR